MTERRVALAAIVVGVLWAGCAEVDPIDVRVFDPDQNSGSADFSILVAVGNSLAAGYQNNGIAEGRQRMGHTALVARQVGKVVFSGPTVLSRRDEFVLPGVTDPGTVGTLRLVNLVPPALEPVSVAEAGVPLNTFYPDSFNNLAVPGANVNDVINTATFAFNPFYDLVLRNRGTMLEQADDLQPTFVVLWVGGNDILGKLTNNVAVTPLADFETDYRTIVETLVGLESRPDLVTANIPDFTRLPFAATVPPFLVDPKTQEPVLVEGQMVPLLGPNGPLNLPGPESPGDLVTVAAIPLLEMGVGIPRPFGTGAPLPDVVVLDLAEITAIREATEAFNAVIADVAATHGIPVVDAAALFDEAIAGIVLGGVVHNTDFITGGLIGLDGVHPTDLGHAVLANAFLEVINDAYGASIPGLDLSEFVGTAPPGP